MNQYSFSKKRINIVLMEVITTKHQDLLCDIYKKKGARTSLSYLDHDVVLQ